MRTVAAPFAGVILASLVLLQSCAPSVPLGQRPLTDVTDLATLRSDFNRAGGTTRVILSLAPSCPYCLKGASTIQRILARYRHEPLTVFVVWQPVLATDWSRPGTSVLRRLSDFRVRQLWDPGHLVARALEQSSQGRELQPGCCFQKGLWWDMIAVYPPGAEWGAALPLPLVLDGTVDDAAPAFEAVIASSQRLASRLPLFSTRD